MSTSTRGLHYTYAEYLSLEEEASFRHEYLIFSHRQPHLTLHRRGEDGWTELTASPGSSLSLVCVAAQIGVDELYEGLEEV